MKKHKAIALSFSLLLAGVLAFNQMVSVTASDMETTMPEMMQEESVVEETADQETGEFSEPMFLESVESTDPDIEEQEIKTSDFSEKSSQISQAEPSFNTDDFSESNEEYVNYFASVEDIEVRAKAKNGMFPEGTKLIVEPYQPDSLEYQKAKEALDNDQVERSDFVALDIRFELNGEEIEPIIQDEADAVKVEANFCKDIVPEDLDTGSIRIHHVAESPELKTEEVASEEEGTVQIQDDQLKAAFEVQSFSTFTITWKTGRLFGSKTSATITAHYVDDQGNEIQASKNSTEEYWNTDTVYMKNIAPSIEGYEFVEARYQNKNFDSIKFETKSQYNYDPKKITINTNPATIINYESKEIKLEVFFVYQRQNHAIVQFDRNGGSVNPDPLEMKGELHETIVLPSYPGTKTGSTFIGWSEAKDVSTATHAYVYPPGFEYSLAKRRTTLYAVWSRNGLENVKFFIRLDGIIPEEPDQFETEQYTAGISKTEAVQEKRWIIDRSQENLKLPEKPNDYYVLNDVTANIADGKLPTTNDIKAVLSDFNPENDYILWYVQKKTTNDGWHVDGVRLKKSLKNVRYFRNCYDDSVQVPVGYQVPVNTDIKIGASGGADKQIVTPNRQGYTFMGWNTSPDGTGDMYQPEESLTITEDTSFYAIWSLNISQITITKRITGNMAEKEKQFQFTANIFDADGNPYLEASTDITPDANGSYIFTLGNGDRKNFRVPEGGKCSVSEANEDYEAKYSVNGGQVVSGNSLEIENISTATSVVFTNTKEINPPTGLDDHSNTLNIWILGSSILLFGAAGFIYLRRRLNGTE